MHSKSNVHSILRSRRFNSEPPYREGDIAAYCDKQLVAGLPVRLVGFWGVGSKSLSNQADRDTCEFLQKISSEVTQVGGEVQWHFIFSKSHGLHNGIPTDTIDSYSASMQGLFAEYQFSSQQLEPLWAQYDISFERIEDMWQHKPAGWWEQVPHHEVIEKNAADRNRRLPAVEAAQKYTIMRQLEQSMLETEFAESIFHTFAGSNLRCVLPDLPTLYLYARPGWSNAPWFVEA